jgi:tetratricopeptide (TPR) repeat protein
MNKLAAFALVSCFAVVPGCTTSKAGYVAKGNKFTDSGHYQDAEIQYRKAIQKDHQYGEAYYRLGLMKLKTKNPGEARGYLLRAVQLLPNNIDAKEKLGSLMLEYYLLDPHHSQVYYTAVKQMSEELLARNPNSFEGLREKGYLAFSDGKPAEGIAQFRKALQANPSDGTLTTVLAKNLLRNGHAQDAENLVLDFIRRDKFYGGAYNFLYELYSEQGRAADSENILEAKVSNNPKEAAYILDLAAYYARLQKQAEMNATLQRLLDDPKDFPQARLWIGDFYARLHAYPEAVQSYQDGIRTATEDQRIEYLKRTVNALVAEGKRQEASRLVDQIVKENPNNEEARRIQASLLLVSGKPESVATAEREFEDLSKQNANDASVWLGLAHAEELKGNLDGARQQYLEALKRDKNFLPARYALAEIALLQNQPELALQQADYILNAQPNAQRARLLRAQALMRSGNSMLARVELTKLSQDFSKDIQPKLELGLVALSDKKYAEAIGIFDKLRPSGDPRIFAGLAIAYSSQTQYQKALETLKEGLKLSPHSVLLLREKAETTALAGEYDLAIAQFQALVATDPQSVTEHLRLGDTYMLKGDDNDGIAAYREAVKLAPQDLNSGLALGRALASAGRANAAKEQLQAVMAAHPDDPLALNEMAFFLSQNGGDLDEALRLGQRALEKAPEQPNFSDTIGYIYLKKGLADSAIRVFRNLVQQYPQYPAFHYHLGMALLQKGEKSRAKIELTTALSSHPSREEEAKIRELLNKMI